tara:strand:- start:10271 stop:10414 length:144 start_codon:yes stop_codon:yes gene_type:complete
MNENNNYFLPPDMSSGVPKEEIQLELNLIKTEEIKALEAAQLNQQGE